jgi:hypothetical protein
VPTRTRPGLLRILVGGVLAGAVIAALQAAWWWGTDRPACRASTDFGACWDTALLVAVVGLPLTVVLGWLALRIGGARYAFLGILALLVALFLGVNLLDPLRPPLAVWPVLAAAFGIAYLALDRRMQ